MFIIGRAKGARYGLSRHLRHIKRNGCHPAHQFHRDAIMGFSAKAYVNFKELYKDKYPTMHRDAGTVSRIEGSVHRRWLF